MSEIANAGRIDGRTARRERGRRAVLDAALRLLSSGGPATTDTLASEAGISTSSLFRYFDGLPDLYRQLAAYLVEQHADLFDAAPSEESDRAQRIADFVELRIRCAEIISPWARGVNAYALTNPEVEPIVMTLRRQTAQHVDRYFAGELSELSPAHRADLAATIDVLTSVEAGRSMGELHDRSSTQVRRAWTTAITVLLDNPN